MNDTIRIFQQSIGIVFALMLMLILLISTRCTSMPELVFAQSQNQPLNAPDRPFYFDTHTGEKKTPTVETACPVPISAIDRFDRLIGAGFDRIAGIYWRTFDLDGNQHADFQIEYNIVGMREDKTFIMTPFPVTYYLDTNGQGFYNEIYIDVNGNGRCEDLKPYTGRARDR